MAYTVVSGHPRVDILASEVSALATRAAGTHATEYGTLKAWCDSHISDDASVPADDYKGWRAAALRGYRRFPPTKKDHIRVPPRNFYQVTDQMQRQAQAALQRAVGAILKRLTR